MEILMVVLLFVLVGIWIECSAAGKTLIKLDEILIEIRDEVTGIKDRYDDQLIAPLRKMLEENDNIREEYKRDMREYLDSDDYVSPIKK